MVNKIATPEQKARAAIYQQQWRAANPEKWKAIARPSRDKWRAKNYIQDVEINRSLRYVVRREILDLLGGQKCVHCGFDKDWRCLQIDHINGSGKKDSRTAGGNTNLWALRVWLKKNPEGWQSTYQVLCANCNWIKRFEKGEHSAGYTVSQRMEIADVE